MERLAKLREARLTAAMVAKEFICRRIAPLQRRSHPMWETTGSEDGTRLGKGHLSAGVVIEAWEVLFPGEAEEMPYDTCPVHRWANKVELVTAMPRFDQWGPIRTELEELREDSSEAESASGDYNTADSEEESSKESSPPARHRLRLGKDDDDEEDAFRVIPARPVQVRGGGEGTGEASEPLEVWEEESTAPADTDGTRAEPPSGSPSVLRREAAAAAAPSLSCKYIGFCRK